MGIGSERVENFELGSSVGHLLRRCNQRSRLVYEKHLGGTGVSRQQLALMISISQNPKMTYSQLSVVSAFERNTLADMIERLIRTGVVSKQQSANDGRAYEVEITDKGKVFLEGAIREVEQVQQEILYSIPQDKRDEFLKCLRLIADLEMP